MDSYSSDSSSSEEPGYYTREQQRGLDDLNSLMRSNQERGMQQYFRANPPDEGMQAAMANAVATLQSYTETLRTLQDARRSYDRHPNSERRYNAYASASEAHDLSTNQWIQYGTHFHEEVATALDFRDQDARRMAEQSQAPVAQMLAHLNSENPQQQNNGNNNNRHNGNRHNDNRHNNGRNGRNGGSQGGSTSQRRSGRSR
ncbi:hypothetical protein [Streptomyces sp. NPDC006012]|uniref:hypothetical protein n=1 Tax=Streptomyces sp. NPDC006012 TaxID=3364739 RepID=UPI0036C87D99